MSLQVRDPEIYVDNTALGVEVWLDGHKIGYADLWDDGTIGGSYDFSERLDELELEAKLTALLKETASALEFKWSDST